MLAFGNQARAERGDGVGKTQRRDGGSDDPHGRQRTSSEDATRFRATEARCIFGGNDCPDLQLVAEDTIRSMATPSVGDMEKADRISKYLDIERLRGVQRFRFTRDDGVTHAFSDPGWARCLNRERGSIVHMPVHDQALICDAEGNRVVLCRSRVVRGHARDQ